MNTFELDPGTLTDVLQSKRFLALSRANVDPATIGTWNDRLLREQRLLVPIDLQALYVPADGGEPMLRLPMLLAGAGVQDPQQGMPAPFTDGQPRPAGVHLHWAMPDALLRGRLGQVDDGQTNRLSLPPLPDRWVVLRLLLPAGGHQPVLHGWVLEADRAVAVPLEQWSEGSAASQQATPAGLQVEAGQLTGTVGGAVNWSAVYDAVLNRFAFHDPLDDLTTVAPNGVDGNAGAYLVAGWWSQPADDPLDAARSAASLGELLDQLGWRLLADFGDARSAQLQRTSEETLRATLGLATGSRFDAAVVAAAPAKLTAAAAAAAAAPAARPLSAISAAAAVEQPVVSSSKFLAGGGAVFRADPWHLRSSLLHGAVYGVPLTSLVAPDQRPDGSALRVALGRHDDDVLAALASLPDTPAEQRRDIERLLAAFTAQTLPEIGSPDGLVASEEHEHDAGFGSLPGGIAGSDRFTSGGRDGTLTAGRRRQTVIEAGVRKTVQTRPARPQLLFAAEKPGLARLARPAATAAAGQYELVQASELQVHGLMHDPSLDDQQAAQPREVARPAPPYEFPTDPLVAVQGPARSLRHGGDGRGSADGKLGCRWPSQVIRSVQGLLDGSQLLPSLGNGSIPEEVLLLAREVLLHDPYHLGWLTAAAPLPDDSLRGAAGLRLQAEAALRFGLDGSFDGGTTAFAAAPLQTARPGAAAAPAASPLEQRLVADELRRFSLVRGADPDLVGVTAWSQPWVPLWLEWQATLTGPDMASLDGWQLGSIDLDPVDGQPPPQPATRTLRGRSLLTTGAATTMRRAVLDYLAAENARDAAGSGEIDDQTQTALAQLADSVANVDVVTAALDGLRLQLLGLPFDDGLRRAADGSGGISKPAPTGPPTLLTAGSLQLARARLVDAFGRLLELPLDSVATTVDTAAATAGSLQQRPRLTRPARWQFRLVDAAAATGDLTAADARVDQVDPSKEVNPVCGFLLPNHLDESLEVHAVDGSPLGELLHDPVAGSVIWEIAAGRAGPADAGPSFGLAPAQQPLGLFAAGLVAADTAARAAGNAGPESPLSALLRAIDTTLWTVDTFAQLGSEHVAGMVGRPLAVVRCQLRLELLPEDDLDLSNADRAAERAAAERQLATVAFPVRVGELTRSDDGVLGFFVDDDYSRYRLVDKAVAELAREAGRNRGQLGLLGQAPTLPPADPITHPYIAAADSDDTLLLHLGQTVTLTLLLVPTGKAYLTSGIVPRETLQLARDWVAPGLTALAPTLRTGPLLVETDLNDKQQVRLPKVSVYGTNQAFLWRDTPAGWRTDAILAATQTALLPDTAAAFRDGWIRAVPTPPDQPAGGQSQ